MPCVRMARFPYPTAIEYRDLLRDLRRLDFAFLRAIDFEAR